MPLRPYSISATQQMVTQIGRRIKALTWQLGRVQNQNAPQSQEIANLQQAIADAQAELAVATRPPAGV